jgi:FAD/FMN-containing dehydrogenase
LGNFAVTTRSGDSATLPLRALDALDARLDGTVVYPEDDAFAETTQLWNGMIRKRPALVVRPASKADVTEGIRFARDNNLLLSIKGGGHNIAGLALADGAVTLDMRQMRDVRVDADRRLVHVSAGCNLGDVDGATQQHGLATTLGFVSATGVAGLTLGGGFGYLTRRFGWTVDDLQEVEIVTADGEVHRASRTDNEDLFWALRGGGGNFGVATEFVFATHEVGPRIVGGLIAWPASEADAVLDLYRRVTDHAPRELTLVVIRRNAPPAPWLPAEAHGTPIILFVVCHSGDPDQARADLEPIKSFGKPLADLITEKDYAAQQTMLDATQPKGMNYYWKSEWLPGVSDELFASYNAQFDGLKAPANQAVLFHVGGALNEHPEDDGAVGNRDAQFACVVQAMWSGDDESVAQANRDWVRSAWQALKQYSTGGNYINFQTLDEPAERLQESYRGNLERLQQIKAKYDPANFFRVNRNIAM